jgi:hypothetical protein
VLTVFAFHTSGRHWQNLSLSRPFNCRPKVSQKGSPTQRCEETHKLGCYNKRGRRLFGGKLRTRTRHVSPGTRSFPLYALRVRTCFHTKHSWGEDVPLPWMWITTCSTLSRCESTKTGSSRPHAHESVASLDPAAVHSKVVSPSSQRQRSPEATHVAKGKVGCRNGAQERRTATLQRRWWKEACPAVSDS